MAGVNRVILVGKVRNLSDRELTETPGKVYVSFFIEVSGWYSDPVTGKGATTLETLPVRFSVKNPKLLDYLKENRTVYIEGNIHVCQRNEPQYNCGVIVVATNLQLIDSSGDKPKGVYLPSGGAGAANAGDDDDMPY